MMARQSLVICLLILWWVSPLPAADNETVQFFYSGEIPELKLVIHGEEQQHLRDRPREYTTCRVIEGNTTTFRSVGVKLKGAAGSYRDFDDRPGLTLSFSKFKKGQRWHGMEKVHLNNLVQDESYLSEWLGTQIFRQARYPAPLTGHVRLWINDRDMGIYVLREGFDRSFVKRELNDAEGRLYDRGEAGDIDTELEMDIGNDPEERSDLIGLAIACDQPDPAVRWPQIAQRADLDRMLTFMALERLCGHWDGYSQAVNNYRIYFPKKAKALFLPHGMDQLFQDPGAGLFDDSPGLVTSAVMENDSWRKLYQAKLRELLPILKPIDPWLARIDERRDRLQPILETVNPDQAAAHRDRVNELKDRLTQRAEALEGLINDGMPIPLEFDDSQTTLLTDWSGAPEGEDAVLDECEHAGVNCYRIAREVFGDHGSSWRRRVLLTKGRYRFQARAKTDAVLPIPDEFGRGVGIRRSGTGRSEGLIGTNDWQTLVLEFEVLEDLKSVELILELRGRWGTAWFERDSLQLSRE